jgi:hypothetical protein
MSDKHQNYLFDLGLLIKERALAARRERDESAPDALIASFSREGSSPSTK